MTKNEENTVQIAYLIQHCCAASGYQFENSITDPSLKMKRMLICFCFSSIMCNFLGSQNTTTIFKGKAAGVLSILETRNIEMVSDDS